MRIRSSNKRGFTLIEIMLVVGIIGMIAAIAIPNFVKARETAQTKACIKNLSVVDAAKQIWGVENGKKEGDEPDESDLVGPTLYIKVMPACPGGGTYSINPIGTTTSCSVSGHVLD